MKVITKIHPELDEVFEYIGIKSKCVEDNIHNGNCCTNCAFYNSLECDTICCASRERYDERAVHFEKVD